MYSHDQAELLAAKALGWLAKDSDILVQFLGWSGADIADLRKASTSPEMLLSVLDFILLQDDWVIAASDDMGIRPQNFATLRASLPGGAESHWT
ncbi:MAG: DUF3572 domain-containing protein [Pseudomonadota bacterium]